ncbi:hypothetical protein D9M72_575850 [compost metagenome]
MYRNGPRQLQRWVIGRRRPVGVGDGRLGRKLHTELQGALWALGRGDESADRDTDFTVGDVVQLFNGLVARPPVHPGVARLHNLVAARNLLGADRARNIPPSVVLCMVKIPRTVRALDVAVQFGDAKRSGTGWREDLPFLCALPCPEFPVQVLTIFGPAVG